MKTFEIVLQSGKNFTFIADTMSLMVSGDIQLLNTNGCDSELVAVIPQGAFVGIINSKVEDKLNDERFTIGYLLQKIAEQKEVRLYNGLKEYIKLYNIKYLDELDVTRIKKKIRNFGHKSESTLKKIIKELTENNESTD